MTERRDVPYLNERPAPHCAHCGAGLAGRMADEGHAALSAEIAHLRQTCDTLQAQLKICRQTCDMLAGMVRGLTGRTAEEDA